MYLVLQVYLVSAVGLYALPVLCPTFNQSYHVFLLPFLLPAGHIGMVRHSIICAELMTCQSVSMFDHLKFWRLKILSANTVMAVSED